MKILLNVAHTSDTPGKCSPDGSFKEHEYSKMICQKISSELESCGFSTEIIEQETFYGPASGLLQVVKEVNKRGSDCILVSIHVNAAGNGKSWCNARGWSAYTSIGKTRADILAENLYWAAGLVFGEGRLRKDTSDRDKDIEANFYILKHTICPAVLTENFFMDNIEDLDYLTSQKGIDEIVKVHVDGILAYLQKQ